jgi:hypothetical protein
MLQLDIIGHHNDSSTKSDNSTVSNESLGCRRISEKSEVNKPLSNYTDFLQVAAPTSRISDTRWQMDTQERILAA